MEAAARNAVSRVTFALATLEVGNRDLSLAGQSDSEERVAYQAHQLGERLRKAQVAVNNLLAELGVSLVH